MRFQVNQVKRNSNGIFYRIVVFENNTYSVQKLCENYCNYIKGGIKKTWRYVVDQVDKEQAVKIYERRTK